MTSRSCAPSGRVFSASDAPGASTGTAYARKSGMRSARFSTPPFACAFAPIRRVPFGATSRMLASGAPAASKSSSGR
jgi:hypothetical protein